VTLNDNSTIEKNTGFGDAYSLGGGIGGSGTLTLNDQSAITENRATFGAGINNSPSGIVILNDEATVSSNGAELGDEVGGQGGGILNEGSVTLKDQSSIVGNTSTGDETVGLSGYGGGVFNEGSLTLLGSSFVTQNTADIGGGVYNLGGSVTITPPASVTDNTPDDCNSC